MGDDDGDHSLNYCHFAGKMVIMMVIAMLTKTMKQS